MYSKTLLAALCLNSLVVAAPVPNNRPSGSTEPDTWSWTKTIQNVAGSPFGNGVNNGNGNSAGNGNKGNGNNNFGGNGNQNGNDNSFGNGNGLFSGNSGLSIGRRNDWSKQSNGQPWGSSSAGKPAWSISDIAGSPFGNGNGNGNGNTAGSGNSNNGNGNFGNNGNGNGNNNEFGNDNFLFSGNQGIGIGKKVRREASAAAIPPGTFYLVPPQLADSLNQDFSQLFTVVIPETGPAVIKGALTGKYPGTKRDEQLEKRQVLTGLEDIIAQAVGEEAPPNRSGFFGINIK